MKGKWNISNDKNAVSPVIGVMLMIVVTVILAAAVSSFAGSMQTKDKPTHAVFDVRCSASEGLITIKHLGGDIIYKEDIKIEISSGLPRMTGYLPRENLTFYPADQKTRDAAMDKIGLEPGQIATYKFRQEWIEYDPDPFGLTPQIEPNVTMYHPVLGEQVVVIGETFRFAIVDIASENTVFATQVVMEP